jgi:hypothetical protein
MSPHLDHRAVPVAARRRETASTRLVLALFDRGTPGLRHDADPEALVVALLDEAHAMLPSREVADLLIRVDRALEPLRQGDAPRRPAPRMSQRPGGPGPPVRVYLRPITVALYVAATRAATDPLARTALAHRLSARIEEIAVRPVACAVGYG